MSARRKIIKSAQKALPSHLLGKGTAYVSGGMTGIPENNFPAFFSAEKKLKQLGYRVLNPARNPKRNSWEEYMRLDIPNVCQSNVVFVLPGWQSSRGANFEVLVAKTIKIPVLDIETMQLAKSENIASIALRLVYGDRNSDYGHPIFDFRRTAYFMMGVLCDKLKDGAVITVHDVWKIMCGVKISREVNKPKEDNRIDQIGYVLTGQKIFDYIEEHGEEPQIHTVGLS